MTQPEFAIGSTVIFRSLNHASGTYRCHADAQHDNMPVHVGEITWKDSAPFLIRVIADCASQRYAHIRVGKYQCAFWAAPWELDARTAESAENAR